MLARGWSSTLLSRYTVRRSIARILRKVASARAQIRHTAGRKKFFSKKGYGGSPGNACRMRAVRVLRFRSGSLGELYIRYPMSLTGANDHSGLYSAPMSNPAPYAAFFLVAFFVAFFFTAQRFRCGAAFAAREEASTRSANVRRCSSCSQVSSVSRQYSFFLNLAWSAEVMGLHLHFSFLG
jgi:hypothetical protein